MTNSAESAPDVSVERSFETPIDVVWAALTRPEILTVWFREGAEAEARPGGVFRDRAGDAGQYVEVTEPRRLVLSWKRAGGQEARLAFDLTENGGATFLRVALSALPDEKERARQAEFWHWAVDSLESFLKTGAGIPYSPWREMQTELHRRARTKTAQEAEAEREAAGVVIAPLAPEPVAGEAPSAPPEGKAPAKKTSAKRRPAKPRKPAKKTPAKGAARKKSPSSRRGKPRRR